MTCDAVEKNVCAACGKRVVAAELGVEIAEPCHVHIGLVGHLVVEHRVGSTEVLHSELGVALEWHRPIGVETAVRVDGDHAGTDLRESAPAVGEEIAEGHFNSWMGSVVPISPQHQRPPVVAMRGEPDVSDHAGTVDVSHRKRGARRDDHRGRYLPANPKVPGGPCSGAPSGPAASALGAAEVLSADRSGSYVAQPGDVAAFKRHGASFPYARGAVGCGLLRPREPRITMGQGLQVLDLDRSARAGPAGPEEQWLPINQLPIKRRYAPCAQCCKD